jgi:hypothetical protein
MTSFAFILGVVPLMLSVGAGAEMRVALGYAVFCGMLGVTFFGIFLTPVFYVAVRWVASKFRPGPAPLLATEGLPHAPVAPLVKDTPDPAQNGITATPAKENPPPLLVCGGFGLWGPPGARGAHTGKHLRLSLLHQPVQSRHESDGQYWLGRPASASQRMPPTHEPCAALLSDVRRCILAGESIHPERRDGKRLRRVIVLEAAIPYSIHPGNRAVVAIRRQRPPQPLPESSCLSSKLFGINRGHVMRVRLGEPLQRVAGWAFRLDSPVLPTPDLN